MGGAKRLASQEKVSSWSAGARSRTSGWLVQIVAGFLLMQSAWILAVPAFRGVDEFEHAHRAASVADGHWAPATEAAVAGRGRLVSSTHKLVEAAQSQCEFYIYTRPDNCRAVRDLGDGDVAIASAATDQPPTIYALVGYPSTVADGTASLYVMRACAAVLCTLMIGLGVWALRQWANGPWPLMTLLAATTPVAVYSTVIPSGNGLEMVSGFALWCTLLGLSAVRDVRRQRLLLLACAPPLAFLCGLRQLGPVMAVGIILIALVLLGRRRANMVYREHRRTVVWLGVVALASAVSQAAWVLVASRYPAGPTDPVWAAPSLAGTTSFGRYNLQWLLQSFAAFPTRTEPAPPVVYAVLLLTSIAMVTYAFWRARGRSRAALVMIIMLSVLLPVVFTLTYWEPAKWQGRYGLALAAGCFLVAGHVLDARSRPPALPWVLLWVLSIGAMHVVSVVGLRRFAEPPVGILLPALLMAGGWLLVAVAAVRMRKPASVTVEPGVVGG